MLQWVSLKPQQGCLSVKRTICCQFCLRPCVQVKTIVLRVLQILVKGILAKRRATKYKLEEALEEYTRCESSKSGDKISVKQSEMSSIDYEAEAMFLKGRVMQTAFKPQH